MQPTPRLQQHNLSPAGTEFKQLVTGVLEGLVLADSYQVNN